MTLIVYVLTPEYAVMASDRRITSTIGDRVVSQEDKAVKTFFYNGQLLVGFTGLAELDGKPMERWLGEALSGVAPNHAPNVLRDAMNDYYARHREVRGLSHHFQAAGFAYQPGRNPPAWPMGFGVGNARTFEKGGRKLLTTPRSEFASVINLFGNHKFIVGAVGAPYSLVAIRSLESTVRNSIRANPHHPGPVYRAIISFMRGVAQRSNGWVGDSILLTFLPREAVPVREIGWTIPLLEDAAYTPSPHPAAFMVTSGSFDPQVYAPALIYPDIQFSGFTFGPQRTT